MLDVAEAVAADELLDAEFDEPLDVAVGILPDDVAVPDAVWLDEDPVEEAAPLAEETSPYTPPAIASG